MLLVFNISENSVIFDEGYEIHKVRNMKRTFFCLMAVLMTALTFTACEKSEQDEPEVKKPSIEEVLRLDDILYKPGDIVDVDVMTAQYQKMGYKMYSDRRVPNSLYENKLAGPISYYNEQYRSLILYEMIGNVVSDFPVYSSQLFTYDMKADVVQYINNRYNITLVREEDSGYYPNGTKDFYRFIDENNGYTLITLRIRDTSCEFVFAQF